MACTIGVLRERGAGETRVSIVPEHVEALRKRGMAVCVERGAGERAGFSDGQYAEAGAEVAERAEVMRRGEVLMALNAAEQWQGAGQGEMRSEMRAGQVIVGYCAPYRRLPFHDGVIAARASAVAVEAIPRITRAQSMDVLSSMANISGYKAALLAAAALPKMFPLMMTAAGTIVPAKVLVLGAGVAGLQAIATAKRLGAVVSAYDIRREVREQIESLGAKFVELPLDAQSGEGSGGYAREMGADFYARQQALLLETVRESDVIICTAAVPGKKAPLIITEEMVAAMAAGSVIVDIAAGSGGNCACTEPDREVKREGVAIFGPTQLATTMSQTASKLYSRNMSAILGLLSAGGEREKGEGTDTGEGKDKGEGENAGVRLNLDDEVLAAAVIIDRGVVRRAELQEKTTGE